MIGLQKFHKTNKRVLCVTSLLMAFALLAKGSRDDEIVNLRQQVSEARDKNHQLSEEVASLKEELQDCTHTETTCDDGWFGFQDYCYKPFRSTFLPFDSAQAFCEDLSGDLATMPNKWANEYIYTQNDLPVYYWTGLKNEDWDKKPWHWADGRLVDQNQTNIYPGSIQRFKQTFPNELGCALLVPPGQLDVQLCRGYNHPLCSKRRV